MIDVANLEAWFVAGSRHLYGPDTLKSVAEKVMSQGLQGGTSFMEDYTYHFKNGGQVLGAHMLEVCPSIAEKTPSVEIHPLSIGGKGDPVRLVFTASSGSAVNASIID